MDSTRDQAPATVCLIGSFPTAPSGQALINESFRRMAKEAGADVRTIDLSPRPGPASWGRRMSRIPRVLVGIPSLCLLLLQQRANAVYVGVAGGYGQLYDLIFVSLVRFSGVRLFLHHDSYAYLGRRRRLTAIIVRIAGISAKHIVGCDDMKERLTRLYGRHLDVVVVSNVTNTEEPSHEPRARTQLRTLGFLAYLSRSKGVLEFLDVAERVHNACPDVRSVLAGPIFEPSLAPVIEKRVTGASWIEYLGPVYGEAKSLFYADIDAFVFPTRFGDEADPRVINEALAHGVPVVARDRGCIGSVVGNGGAIIREGSDFVAEAERLIIEWYRDPALLSSMSASALANTARLESDHRTRLEALITELVAVPLQGAVRTSPVPRSNGDGSRGDKSSR